MALPEIDALAALATLATTAADLRAYRTGVLDVLARVVPFDAALYHAFAPAIPLHTAVMRGLPMHLVEQSLGRWDDLANVLGAIRDHANREGVATDRVLPKSARKVFLDRVAKPFGQRAVCMSHLIVRGRVVAAVALFSRREKAFFAEHVAALTKLLPTIAAGDALHQLLDGGPRASQRTRLECTDQRLTPRQRNIVEHVALGHTNAEIAEALGLSPNSVRNHLVRVFARLGASNRADVVRLAVLG